METLRLLKFIVGFVESHGLALQNLAQQPMLKFQKAIKMLIKLSPSEMRLCKLIGAMRYATTSDVCAEQIQSDMNPLEIVVDGVIGEYCVSKHLNLHFSLDTDLREWGADLVTYQGKTVDVKSTRAKGGRLNATKSSDKKNYDIYILCELNDEGADIVGWVTRDSFLKPENIAMGKRGEYYAIDRSKLNTTFTGGQS